MRSTSSPLGKALFLAIFFLAIGVCSLIFLQRDLLNWIASGTMLFVACYFLLCVGVELYERKQEKTREKEMTKI